MSREVPFCLENLRLLLYTPTSDSPDKKDCDKVTVEVEVTSSLPKRVSNPYEMAPIQKTDNHGKPFLGLRFHPDAADDSDAMRLFDEQARREDKARGEA